MGLWGIHWRWLVLLALLAAYVECMASAGLFCCRLVCSQQMQQAVCARQGLTLAGFYM
jgi:hypothetical protein